MTGERVDGVAIKGRLEGEAAEILTAEALAFLAGLERDFRDRRAALLDARVVRQAAFDRGEDPDFRADGAGIREGDWRIAELPADLRDRRVEITGPVERKMIINALNSGANVFMADFEDSAAPSWANMMAGQVNLRDAVAGTISFTDPARGKSYELGPEPAVLKVRPRGWHLDEAHIEIDGRPVSASLCDFALFFFHNARALLDKGSGPYFYLPKLETAEEAALWNDVFVAAQNRLGIAPGSIRATVLIETITAAFEMDEILHALRDHSAGLNCGRWDYIFSYIKKFRSRPDRVLPDRGHVTMTVPFMRAYSLLAIRTCHRRGAPAIGGMSAFIPVRDDPDANEAALAKVRADKSREAEDGHDGSWVAHPGLVAPVREIFDALMPGANQIERQRADVEVTAADLLACPDGPKSEAGLRQNVAVGLGYLEAWLRGTGCVPLFNMMEDAATAEISRAQLWQWRVHGAVLEDGRPVTAEFIDTVLEEELTAWRERGGDGAFRRSRFAEAAGLMRGLVLADDFVEFLTLPAYPRITEMAAGRAA